MKRFVLKKDDDGCYIYDKQYGTCELYVDENDVPISLEFIALLNNLNNELKVCEDIIKDYEYYIPLEKKDLIVQNKRFRANINYERGLKKLEFNYCKEVLDGLIKDYPKSQGLLDFKKIMDW